MKQIRVTFVEQPEESDITVTVSASAKDAQVLELLERLNNPLTEMIPVFDAHNQEAVIPVSGIISISSESRRLKVISEEGEFEMRMPLYEAEKLLDPASFLRISRYEIIQLSKVRRFDFTKTGALRIEMKNGMRTWASRRKIGLIRRLLSERGNHG